MSSLIPLVVYCGWQELAEVPDPVCGKRWAAGQAVMEVEEVELPSRFRQLPFLLTFHLLFKFPFKIPREK